MKLTLRPTSEQDEGFLRHLIIETAAAELGASAWPEPLRSQILDMEYARRRHANRTNDPEVQSSVIQVDGVDAGWIVLVTMPDHLYLSEIMILPELRGGGIGTVAIGQVLSKAGEAGKPVRLRVNVMNPRAARLYERVGFRRIDGDEVQHVMECRPPTGS
jgi:ribosomal protein S18 acetylase RimI-like enzyme